MKVTSLLLTALLGSNISAATCSGIRALKQAGAANPTPLEEVKTADGAVVQFFENIEGSGLLVAASTVPDGAEDPLATYLDASDTDGTPKSLAAFYEHVSGEQPSGLLLEAINRQSKNEASESLRMKWETPETATVSAAADTTQEESLIGGDGGDGRRSLCLNCGSPVGSRDWFVNVACRSSSPYEWCSCLPSRTGSAYKVKTSEDFFQQVYVYGYRGAIEHKLEYWTCATGKCQWKFLISRYVSEGTMSTMWAEGGGRSWTYKGSTYNADGDVYHLSWYDQEDTDLACDIAGLGGCYVCPSIA